MDFLLKSCGECGILTKKRIEGDRLRFYFSRYNRETGEKPVRDRRRKGRVLVCECHCRVHMGRQNQSDDA